MYQTNVVPHYWRTIEKKLNDKLLHSDIFTQFHAQKKPTESVRLLDRPDYKESTVFYRFLHEEKKLSTYIYIYLSNIHTVESLYNDTPQTKKKYCFRGFVTSRVSSLTLEYKHFKQDWKRCCCRGISWCIEYRCSEVSLYLWQTSEKFPALFSWLFDKFVF